MGNESLRTANAARFLAKHATRGTASPVRASTSMVNPENIGDLLRQGAHIRAEIEKWMSVLRELLAMLPNIPPPTLVPSRPRVTSSDKPSIAEVINEPTHRD